MRRLLQRGLSAATVTCGLFFAGQALAGGSGMPWEGPLQQIVESITGPVVQAAAVVAVVLFGAGVAMSENGSSMRRGLAVLDDALFGAPAARENAAIGSGDGEAHSRHLVRGAEGSFKRRR
ncbi:MULTISPECIES: TrbC/VirB2 family protein [Brevundimonas]|uniref:TrbC/VirB2 family protein n=1 Tax=Brevundimonas TaxID=41275 RepID=UPI0025C152FA|nr:MULTISPECIES: TrbC/VirB2 family protein [Brevundimonas]